MKLDILLFAKFFVLINFSIGQIPDEAKAEMKDRIYSSYKDNVKKLTTNKIQYLVKDLDKIYEMGYDEVSLYWDFVHDNRRLMQSLDTAKLGASSCLKKDLIVEMNNYKVYFEELSKILEKTPENPTCYKDLMTYFEHIKYFPRERLSNDKLLDEAEKKFWKLESYMRMLDNRTIEVPNQMIGALEEMLTTYMSEMISHSNSTIKKRILQNFSMELVERIKTDFDRTNESLQKYGIFNKTIVSDFTVQANEVEKACQNTRRILYSANTTTYHSVSAVIDEINKYANAKYYIIGEEDNKKQLDCEDHVPCFGARPMENEISISMDDGKVTLIAKGTDADGRKYKRNLKSDGIRDGKTTVNEIIEYGDEIVDRTYVIEFSRAEKT